MRGNAFLGDAVHLLRADLDFEGLPGVNHSGMQRLVQIGPRHRDVILEAPGDGPPDVVDDTQRGVTAAVGIRDHSDGQQIVNLVEAALLAHDFAVQRIEALDARLQLRGNAVFHQLGADGALDLFEKSLVKGSFVAELLLQGEVGVRLQVTEGEVFEFALNDGHSQAVSDRGVNIHRLPGDAQLLGWLQKLQRTHVVQTVGQLHHHHADVLHHGQKHLADVFRLARFRGHHVQAADFGDALDELSDLTAKAFLEARNGKLGVFDNVMQQSGRQCGGVHADVGQDVRHFQEMGNIGVARCAELVVVAFGGYLERASHRPGAFRCPVGAKLFEQLFQARVQLPLSPVTVEVQRDIRRRRHSPVYQNPPLKRFYEVSGSMEAFVGNRSETTFKNR